MNKVIDYEGISKGFEEVMKITGIDRKSLVVAYRKSLIDYQNSGMPKEDAMIYAFCDSTFDFILNSSYNFLNKRKI
ncbi:MAG: hypothetical protein WC812_02095 [Candidatus Pacearchaeota archaeon]|jgi:hypothetical protein